MIHQHPEGVAGAIAVAVAAAQAWRTRDESCADAATQIWDAVIAGTPKSDVREGLLEGRDLSEVDAGEAAARLGNGSRISAMDTVPFVVWSACHGLADYQEALWQTVAVGGDRDTTCAMVGGIVILRHGLASVPETWRGAVEDLDW